MTNTASDPDCDEKERAESERETVDQALHRRRHAALDRADASHAQQGITNRSSGDEQCEQAKLPPRGEAKGEGDRG
jgi:hypothetical protein